MDALKNKAKYKIKTKKRLPKNTLDSKAHTKTYTTGTPTSVWFLKHISTLRWDRGRWRDFSVKKIAYTVRYINNSLMISAR